MACASAACSRDLPSASSGETRRAELGHWLALAGGPVFALWNPVSGLVLMLAYGVVTNVPFIAVQRYNRQRAQRISLRQRTTTGLESLRCGLRSQPTQEPDLGG